MKKAKILYLTDYDIYIMKRYNIYSSQDVNEKLLKLINKKNKNEKIDKLIELIKNQIKENNVKKN